ncbi:MAG: AhpC/TSA family protein [Bacteroidetes bacterium]|nr:MAG: AhpC/TSA family protein [Bacteroidota bacterium]
MYISKTMCVFILGVLIALTGIAQQTCTVEVTTKNIPNGTWFYLADSETNATYDSAQANNNKFTLRAALDKEAVQAIVYEKKYNAYIVVWLAPGKLQIVQNDKTLRTAKVTGNEMAAHDQEFKQLINPVTKALEKLGAKIEQGKDGKQIKEWMKQYELKAKEEAQLTRDYVRKYKNRLFSAHILDVYKTTWGTDTVAALFNPMAASIKQTGYGTRISKYLAFAAPSNIGDMAAEVKQPSPAGDSISLNNYKGKWVLLEFWASWCGPCREENPTLKKTYETFKTKNFEIIGISLDKSREAWIKAIQTDGLPWPQVSELNGNENSAALAYSVSAIPVSFLIDPSGKIVARDLDGELLNSFLQKRL